MLFFNIYRLCFEKLGLIGPDDYTSIVLRVFQKLVLNILYLK